MTYFAEKRFDETRVEKLRILEQYFLHHLVDDPMDGSTFDCDVLDAIKLLKARYSDEGK